MTLPVTQWSLRTGKRRVAKGRPSRVLAPLSSCPTWHSPKRGDMLPYLVATQPCVSAVIGPPSPAAWDSPALLFLSGLGPTPVGGRDP